jgi:hypothetical protein
MSRSYAPIVRQTKPPEPVLGAIGLAGELAAFNYLKHKHRTRFSDRCWVSENRGTAFPDPGDPTLDEQRRAVDEIEAASDVFAASCARTTPARLLRSTIARPFSPSTAACSNNSSHDDAPRRNENAT